MQSEINESMAYNPADSVLDVTTADLEQELSDILAGAGELGQPDTPQPAVTGFQNPSAGRTAYTAGMGAVSPQAAQGFQSPGSVGLGGQTSRSPQAAPVGFQSPKQTVPVGFQTHISPMANISPSASAYGQPQRISPHAHISTSPGLFQQPQRSPQQMGYQSPSGSGLNRTFTLDDSGRSSSSQISGASFTLDSYGLPSMEIHSSDPSDLSEQLEALKVIEGELPLVI